MLAAALRAMAGPEGDRARCGPSAGRAAVHPARRAGAALRARRGPPRAHAALVSRESCHVARGASLSAGFGLRKCVMVCWPSSLNNVAWGLYWTHFTRLSEGRQT